MISVMPISPDENVDSGADGQGPPVDVEGNQDENDGGGGDEDMPDTMPTGERGRKKQMPGEPASLSN